MKLPQEVIRLKRDGYLLSVEDIVGFITGVTSGTVSEGQVAAFSMATYFKGMSLEETTALTLAMRDSGDRLTWSGIERPIVDKHSTGGVGDNVSLILAPLMAACGLAVPMISGRGLGHTGGTLDKLESIPGYRIEIDQSTLFKLVNEIGCAIVGPTGNLAPADKRIYSIRDVTATVDSLPLITASILSKKLAAGLQSLVLDVKYGSGAFMQSEGAAASLARLLVDVANAAGVNTSALITDMSEPLANSAGNALELYSALSVLKGESDQTRLISVVHALGAKMLIASGLHATVESAGVAIESALSSGAALELFAKMISSLGGPVDFVERPEFYLQAAQSVAPVKAMRSGWLASCDATQIGMSVVRLGGGRSKPTDMVDHSVGLSDILPIGSRVEAGDTIALLYAANSDAGQYEAEGLSKCWTIEEQEPQQRAVISQRIN